jgi:hypothetical protein
MKALIPNTLRKHRKRLRLRQIDVDQILGFKKLRFKQISIWEKGLGFPNLENVLKLSLLYKTKPEELYSELFKNISQGLQKKMKQRKKNGAKK